MATEYDAIAVGSGPNGLTAAAVLAQEGRRVLVLEASDRVGGGTRTEELTLPGFHHDVCSAVHPLAAASPVFARLPLAEHGFALVQPEIALAHPLDGGRAAVCDRSWDATAAPSDARRWRALLGPYAACLGALMDDLSGPVLHVPRHPLAFARFGLPAALPATWVTRAFRTPEARALFAGIAAHAMLPLSHVVTASFGLLLGAAAHAVGWPAVRGGSQRLADALAAYVRANGGAVETSVEVRSIAALPPARAVFLDTSPRAAARIAGDRLRPRARRSLTRFRCGPAAFKIDYALSEPVPWAAPEARRAGTVHVGGRAEEIVAAERETAAGGHPERPLVLVAQQSLFDDARAPAGRHTLWAYCHVPNGSYVDMTDRIESQIERFAPGFRDVVLARHVITPCDLERRNPNELGGDIGGGSLTGLQLLPRLGVAPDPYRIGDGVYLCSASTPPGPGVHGMCGDAAVRAARRRELRV